MREFSHVRNNVCIIRYYTCENSRMLKIKFISLDITHARILYRKMKNLPHLQSRASGYTMLECKRVLIYFGNNHGLSFGG